MGAIWARLMNKSKKLDPLFWYWIVAEGEAVHLDPEFVGKPTVRFLQGAKPHCDDCGHEILSGRVHGDEKARGKAKIVGGAIACVGCGKAYPLHRGEALTEDEQARYLKPQ